MVCYYCIIWSGNTIQNNKNVGIGNIYLRDQKMGKKRKSDEGRLCHTTQNCAARLPAHSSYLIQYLYVPVQVLYCLGRYSNLFLGRASRPRVSRYSRMSRSHFAYLVCSFLFLCAGLRARFAEDLARLHHHHRLADAGLRAPRSPC